MKNTFFKYIAYKNKIKNTRITNTGGDKTLIISPAFASAWANGSDKGLKYTDSVMRTLFNVDSTAKTIQTNMPSTINLQFSTSQVESQLVNPVRRSIVV